MQFMLGAAAAREMTLPFSKNKFITFAWHWRDVFTLFFIAFFLSKFFVTPYFDEIHLNYKKLGLAQWQKPLQ